MAKVNAPEWIDVNVLLPYSDKSVLIYDRSRGIQIAYIDTELNEWIVPDYCSEVLFWQELPSKPKIEKS